MTSSSVALAWIELSISSASASAVLLYPLARIAVTARCAGMIFLRALAVGGLSIIPNILPIFERLGHISEAREMGIDDSHDLRSGVTLGFDPARRAANHLTVQNERSRRTRDDSGAGARRVEAGRQDAEIAHDDRMRGIALIAPDRGVPRAHVHIADNQMRLHAPSAQHGADEVGMPDTCREDDNPPVASGQILDRTDDLQVRSEEQTSELQSLMRISYAVL